MASKGLAFLAAASILALAGCMGGEGEYKIEGPAASDNPSVAAPIGAGGEQVAQPGAVTGEAPASKGDKFARPQRNSGQ